MTFAVGDRVLVRLSDGPRVATVIAVLSRDAVQIQLRSGTRGTVRASELVRAAPEVTIYRHMSPICAELN